MSAYHGPGIMLKNVPESSQQPHKVATPLSMLQMTELGLTESSSLGAVQVLKQSSGPLDSKVQATDHSATYRLPRGPGKWGRGMGGWQKGKMG